MGFKKGLEILGVEIVFLTHQHITVKDVFGFHIQIDEIAPADLFFVDTQYFDVGIDGAARR